MARGKNGIKRHSNMVQKFQKMKGLEPEEKRIFTRIGELIDAVINNKGPTNPGGEGSRKILRQDQTLPPVTGLTFKTGIRSAKVDWNPVESIFLQFYEIRLTEVATGTETTHIVYSNTYTIKDTFGQYTADVRCVGRDGTVSPFTSLSFEIAPSVISYNGNKNGINDLGFEQYTDIYVPKGYNVFVWGSDIYDSFSDPTANPTSQYSLQLFEGGFYAPGGFYPAGIINIQDVQGFGEEVTFTNLSAVYNQLQNSRPGGAPARSGNYQTAKVIPFSPYTISDLQGNRNNRFFIREANRNDILSLGINAWVTTAGIGFTTGATSTTQSLEFNDPALTQQLRNSNYNTLNFTDSWSVAMWVKFVTGNENYVLRYTPLGTVSGIVDITVDVFGYDVQLRGTNSRGWTNNWGTSPISSNTWHQLIFTFNNPAGIWYVDGVQDSTSGASFNTLGAMADPGRQVFLRGAANFAGDKLRLFWQATWKSTLSNSEATYLYTGVGAAGWNGFDLTANAGNYVSAANLVDWWRPGDGNLGDDGGTNNIALTGFNISTVNLVTDSPS